jgi:predicted DNA-binding transcriptional regulator YafY
MSTSNRLLRLLSLLQGRRDWPGTELASRLEVSARTVRRDVERLRELGYPVESLSGPAGGYRLAAGTAMPPLLLDDEEAIAIAVGLRTAAGAGVTGIEETSLRALVKLEQVLPAHLRRRVQAIGEALQTVTWSPRGATVDPGCLSLLAAGVRDHERVRFAYEGRDGTRTRRDVEPHALVRLGRRWYLVAWDPARDAWRTFRLDRIEEPRPAGVRFTPRKVPGGDAAAFVERNIRTAPMRWDAHVVLHAPAAAFRDRPWLWGQITPLDDERCELRTSEDDLDWLAVRLGMLGCDFEVRTPDELRERLAVLADRVGRAARAPAVP